MAIFVFMDKFDDYVAIAKLLKPFKLKGEIKAIPMSFDLDRHELLEDVFLQKPDTDKLIPVTVEDSREHMGTWFFKFQDIDSPEEADQFRNHTLYIHKDERLELEEGEYYFSDLAGLSVFNEAGKKVGKVKRVIEHPTINNFEVRVRGKYALIPWNEECVKEINLEEQKIVMDFSFMTSVYPFLEEL